MFLRRVISTNPTTISTLRFHHAIQHSITSVQYGREDGHEEGNKKQTVDLLAKLRRPTVVNLWYTR